MVTSFIKKKSVKNRKKCVESMIDIVDTTNIRQFVERDIFMFLCIGLYLHISTNKFGKLIKVKLTVKVFNKSSCRKEIHYNT